MLQDSSEVRTATPHSDLPEHKVKLKMRDTEVLSCLHKIGIQAMCQIHLKNKQRNPPPPHIQKPKSKQNNKKKSSVAESGGGAITHIKVTKQDRVMWN